VLKERIRLRRPLVVRYTLVAGTLGLMAGLAEAAVLYFARLFATVTIPVDYYVIWFVAPLIDMALIGFLGFVLGLSLSLSRQIRPWMDALLTCGLASLAASWPVLAADRMGVPVQSVLARHRWSLEWIYPLVHPLHAIVRHPLALMVVGGAVLLVLGRRMARRLSQIQWPLGFLARVLAAAVMVCSGGVAFYAATQRFWSGPVEANSIPPAHGPNIILITLDTTRADHLSAYGYSRATTPNLDRLAGQGVLFENAIASSSWTLPSHASIFTGLLPHQHGADVGMALRPEQQKLAEILRARGYETAQFSANWRVINELWGLTDGFEGSPAYSFSIRHHMWSTQAGAMFAETFSHWDYSFLSERPSAKTINQEGFGWLDHHSQRPFFLFLNYLEPHKPYVVANSERRPYGDISWSLAKRTALMVGKLDQPLTPAEQAEMTNGYDNCLASLDMHLGEFFQSLAGSPIWPNTVIIITSDHGEAIGDHGGVDHGWNVYRELIHVPLIVLGPGVPPHLRIRQAVETRDIFATVLDLALGGKSGPWRQSSLRRFWTETPAPLDERVVSEISLFDGPSSMISLTTGEWEYIANFDGQTELYDWSKDPGETHNLAPLAEYGQIVAELHTQLCEEIGSTVDPLYGAQYLQAVMAAPNSSPAQAALSCGLQLPASPRRTLRPEDEDLLRTLPYR